MRVITFIDDDTLRKIFGHTNIDPERNPPQWEAAPVRQQAENYLR